MQGRPVNTPNRPISVFSTHGNIGKLTLSGVVGRSNTVQDWGHRKTARARRGTGTPCARAPHDDPHGVGVPTAHPHITPQRAPRSEDRAGIQSCAVTTRLSLSTSQEVRQSFSIQTVAGSTPATRACAPTVSEFYSRRAGLCPVPPDSSEGVHKWGDRLSGEPPASKPSPSAYLTGALVHDQAEDGNSANNNA
jgi:hypothetical protein